MKVGVLAVQGAFAEMEAHWRAKGADVFEIRQRADLERGIDMLALPGGESTVQGKLLNDIGLFAPLRELIDGGLPVFAVCAGLILLAERIEDPGARDETRPEKWFGVLPVTVRRNAYGRQLGSFHTIGEFDGKPDVSMTFIRPSHNRRLARSRGAVDFRRRPHRRPLARHHRLHLAPGTERKNGIMPA